eukprot:TRINITY_DN10397_c0_g2_i1.p1 TRINITY_DN10397_c0_g2~~TRINITY_DN10397_c0_g2_i1.p1  ORF type:complete len:567 (+),score=136.98 TRINITY_DN10397_c0_g2_i1:131-1831(+)
MGSVGNFKLEKLTILLGSVGGLQNKQEGENASSPIESKNEETQANSNPSDGENLDCKGEAKNGGENVPKNDVAVIFAEPDIKDVERLLQQNRNILGVIKSLLCVEAKQEKVEEKLDEKKAEGLQDSTVKRSSEGGDSNSNFKPDLDIEIKDEVPEDESSITALIANSNRISNGKEKGRTDKGGLSDKAGGTVNKSKIKPEKSNGSDSDIHEEEELSSDDNEQAEDINDLDYDLDNEDFQDYEPVKVKKKRKRKKDIDDSDDDYKSDHEGDSPTKKDRDKTFSCEFCGKSFSRKVDVKRHVKRTHETVKMCADCGQSFNNLSTLNKHRRQMHNSGQIEELKCKQCGKYLSSPKYLEIHMQAHEKNSHKEEKLYICQDCGKTFQKPYSLKNHCQVHHEKVYKFACEDCGERFLYQYRLNTHIEQVHKKGEQFMCTKCGKQIYGKLRFKNHLKNHPTNFKLVPCSICDKEMPENQIKSHVAEFHSNKNFRYQCPYCPKKMEKRAFIRGHVRTHTGAKPYFCHKCVKYYNTSSSARRHAREFHRTEKSVISYDPELDVDNPFALIKKFKG